MFGFAISPGLLVGAATMGTLEITGTVKFVAVIAALLAGASTVVGVIYGAKWKSAYDVEHALMKAHADRADLMTEERDESRRKLELSTAVVIEAQKTIARLEALPNLERVLQMVGETFGRLGERLDETNEAAEAVAAKRHADVLAAIRGKAA